MKSKDLHMVPEVIKNIAWKLSPDNKAVHPNERWNAAAQIEAIKNYCDLALKIYERK